MPQLVQTQRRIQIFEALLTEVSEVGIDKAGGRVRENRLTTVRRRADARRPVDVDADVALAGQHRLACVHADAHAHDAGRQRCLALSGSSDGVGGLRKDIEERVTLGVHLNTTMSLEGFTQRSAVLLQDDAIAITELLQEARRTFDVSEE
jgi:hypothetical protein